MAHHPSWRHGPLGVALAPVAGLVVFSGCLFFPLSGYSILPDLPCFPEHTRPTTTMFFWLAVGGLLSALAMTWLAPQYRWYLAAPLLVLMEVGFAVVYETNENPVGYAQGSQSIVLSPFVSAGALAGINLGLIVICRLDRR